MDSQRRAETSHIKAIALYEWAEAVFKADSIIRCGIVNNCQVLNIRCPFYKFEQFFHCFRMGADITHGGYFPITDSDQRFHIEDTAEQRPGSADSPPECQVLQRIENSQ